jgi:hypothetical protein
VVTGEPPSPTKLRNDGDFIPDQAGAAALAATIAPLPFVVALALAIGVPVGIAWVAWPPSTGLVLGLLLYVIVVRTVVLRL